MKINLQLYDEYASEPYNKFHGKPKGILRCGYCDEVYEPEMSRRYDSEEDELFVMVVCSACGEVSSPYEED